MSRNGFSVSDVTLVAQAQRGDQSAFGELASRHSARIYGVSFKMLRNREDAEDNLQNALFKAHRKINQFEGKSRFSTWLTRIAINEAMMMLRKRAAELAVPHISVDLMKCEPEVEIPISDSKADPERACIARELATKAFRQLKPSLSTTFILHKAEGWTHPELARTMGADTSAIKSRIFRARARLRQELALLTQAPSMGLQT